MNATDTTLPTESQNHQEHVAEASKSYTAGDIQMLKNADHIRQAPTMYIGSSHEAGMHHLFYEIIHNSVDEAMAGYAKNIHVTINVDGSITVEDDGRGIPVEEHPVYKRPTLELVLCEVGTGGKFRKDAYKISGGLHGMGIKAVNALSEWTTVEVARNGFIWQQDYERGVPVSPVRQIGKTNRHGTKTTFRPDTDPRFFGNIEFNYDTIENRLRELAYLTPGLAIKLTDERTGKEESFLFKGGIREFVEHINRSDDALHPTIQFKDERDGIRVDVAFQYIASDLEQIRGFSNNIYNPGGGVHVSGLRAALTRTINTYGGKANLIKENLTLIGEDFREGLTSVISIWSPDPTYNNQAKERLETPKEIEGIVSSVVSEHLGRFLEENPTIAKKIVQKVVLAAEAREAAAKARKALKDRKNILSGGGLPGKLMDCTSKNRDECELFLVEGDSAGGSADGGRERLFQAILPLRGKILNVEKARLEKMLDNQEICNIISAIGTDIAEAEDVTKRNYDKIILLTDADVDGSHIRTLLLTFLYRQMPKLVADGHVYLAQPPLYRVIQRKTVRYVQTADILHRDLMQRGLQGTRLQIVAEDKIIEGERLQQLVEAVALLEHSLIILDRRGLGLALLLSHAKNGQLPSHRVHVDHAEHWFMNADEVTAFCQSHQAKAGTEGNGKDAVQVLELHEVKAINRGLEKLREVGLEAESLLPPKPVAGREPAPRFFLDHDGSKKPLLYLRELATEIRHLGEKGMTITRFKGLGEMNPDELWDTTLDPTRRVLLKVRLEDAFKADELFRILMGEKVEPRREFIEKHALEVRNLDV
jgi:DNA gyrase subunit B